MGVAAVGRTFARTYGHLLVVGDIYTAVKADPRRGGVPAASREDDVEGTVPICSELNY